MVDRWFPYILMAMNRGVPYCQLNHIYIYIIYIHIYIYMILYCNILLLLLLLSLLLLLYIYICMIKYTIPHTSILPALYPRINRLLAQPSNPRSVQRRLGLPFATPRGSGRLWA